ncbi:Hsp20/alpha crystallin family protein [Desulfobulbus elongatus]|uniref:Hsp20/alpha crystallin family protein n=1 Tax=Desulfobulbus elongatus TaxID=53332 RepID=UPI00048A41D5|nr:Hsp20/alpha crystallin family protein [Desulfobulbus elongatus]
MELKMLAPWNWFKKEEEIEHGVPITHRGKGGYMADRYYDPTFPIHRDIDRLFDHFFRGFGPMGMGRLGSGPAFGEGMVLKPKVDLSATEGEYLLTVEIPGVSEKDVSVDISGGTLTVKGEKRQEKEEKEKDYYRVERSYGSFQRVLSLPDDVDREGIKAGFKDGVLSITMPRKATSKGEVKQIEITAGS